MPKKEPFFKVSVHEYVPAFDFDVFWPASLDLPCDHAVMFLSAKNGEKANALFGINNCLIFWQEEVPVPFGLEKKHAIVLSAEPRMDYNRFFKKNHIVCYPENTDFDIVHGAYICHGAIVGEGCTIMPGAYIGSGVILGTNVYVGTGSRLVGRVQTGNDVVIRENTVIGADGLSTDRDIDGSALTMPQFGGVLIGDRVQVGANTVIARGAIDNTTISNGCKIDNACFISHNVVLGEDTFVVGETIMFGSSRTGKRAFLSGNSTIRNKVSIGDDALVGMGAVVTKNVPAGAVVLGNPAKERE